MNQTRLEITSICVSCDNCRLICPEDAILSNGSTYLIDTWSCTLCSLCQEVCPIDCIREITKD
ncbi:MAG TPA: 4Fe-4S binding protein [Bacteriovoracaceae bacterium]|nr:4Fe-4S binding protein [Bacteriovoracaceae bacterium]